MRSKSSFWSKPRGKVILPVGDQKGYGYDKRRGEWYTTIYVDGKKERQYNDARNEEQAILERNSRFAALESLGAKRSNAFKPNSAKAIARSLRRPTRKAMSDKRHIAKVKKTIVVESFIVTVHGKYVGTASNRAAAVRKRNAYLKKTKNAKPCATCGKLPKVHKGHRKDVWRVVHDNPDCPNKYRSIEAPQLALVTVWNRTVYNYVKEKRTLAGHEIFAAPIKKQKRPPAV